MIKRLFIVTTLLALVLTSCGGETPAATATSLATEPPTATVPAVVTDTPPPTDTVATEVAIIEESPLPATSTPTEGPPIPTNAPDCTNSAAFVADVTIPDNTNIAGGTTFTKTWRVANNGTCIWGPTYTLSHYSDEILGAPESVPLGVTYPGETLDISVDLTAPNAPGTYRGNFVIKNPAGLIMRIADDSRLWVIINVTETTAVTPTATPTPLRAVPTTTGAETAAATATGPTPSESASSASAAACGFTTDRTKLTEVINAVNAHRARNGLPAYTVNPLLAQAAQRHANDIACNKLYVHTGTDGSTPQSRVADTGYVARSVTENVNGNYPPLSGQAAVNWWINDRTDPRHGQNLVSTTFTEIGVGYAFYENFGFYVIVFARP